MKFKVFISSHRNHTFQYEEEYDLEDYISKDEFEKLTEDQKEEELNAIVTEIIFNEFVEYGVELTED